MEPLARLLGVADRHLQGPSPTFDRTHLLLAFETIGRAGRVGRKALAESSGLGEGAIRTLLKKLRAIGYVDADASGSHLTREGSKVYRELLEKISSWAILGQSQLTVGAAQVALVVRRSEHKVRSGIDQRDSAIMAGASGATTYVIRGTRFTIPGGSINCEKDFPGPAWTNLKRNLKPKDSDTVILCGAKTEVRAKIGALAAALTLL